MQMLFSRDIVFRKYCNRGKALHLVIKGVEIQELERVKLLITMIDFSMVY
jgi:hypothetical protein